MIKIISRFSVMVSFLFIFGCATISGNGKQEIRFDTRQAGLTLNDNKGKYVCDLPCTLTMDGNSSRFFVAKGDGYKSKMVSVDISKNAASRADIFITPTLIDGFTGADVNLDNYIFVELEINE